ncbi:MAG: AraC family transcriptional regulator ligand-binding domain-containing protein [Sphingomonadaceae bacterium]|nr:AraC family transcriptional regulator ligand-binding domain-containing protein [Sphingomonadaceae bacterium]
MATIDRYYFHVCTDGARRQGVDVDALMRSAGVEPADLHDPLWRGDIDAMARLVRGIWSALGDEFMGYTQHPMPIGAFAFACEMARDAGSVGEGMRRAVRFYNLATRDIATRLTLRGDIASIAVRFAEPARDPTHYFSEFWLIIWHRLACWLAGETVPMLDARFDYPRPDAYFAEFKHLFPCPHHFDAGERMIRLDGRALAGPIRRTREELAVMLERAPLDMMTIPASDHGLAPHVRRILTATPGLTLAELAAGLSISPDTVRRTLRGEGTGWVAIREDVRRAAAIRALADSGRSVEAIAADLGYAEPRSFTRAFRSWTGKSPSAYRRGSFRAPASPQP